MKKKRLLMMAYLIVLSGKYINASECPAGELRKTNSKDALNSPASPRQLKQPASLRSSSDRLEKATIRDYGNLNGSAKVQNDNNLTFHNVFYGV